LLAGLLAGPAWAVDCAPEGGQAIAPGATLERPIRGSECHRYVVASTLPLWVSVEGRRVDLSVVLGDRNVESGVERDWMEAVLLEPDADGQAAFAIQAAGKSALSGGYRLTVTALDPADPAAVRLREALELTVRRDHGGAAGAWQHAGRPREAAWMRLAQALAEIDAGRGESAVVLIEEAEALLAGVEHQAARTRLIILRAVLLVEGLGRHAEAALALERAIADGRRLDDPSLLAHVHLVYGLVRHYRDSLDPARLEYQKAADLLARDPDPDPFVQGMLHNNLAGIHYVLGEPEQAFAEFHLAETIARAIGDDLNLAGILNNTAQLRANLGMYDQALVSFKEALGIFEALKQRSDVSRTLRGIGSTYLGLGVFERSREFLGLAIEEAEAAGDVGLQFSARLLLGEVYRHLGQPNLALATHKQALADNQQAGTASNAARAVVALGRDALAAGHAEEALAWLESAVTTFRAHQFRRELADSLYALGTARLATGDLREADVAFSEAEKLQRELGDDRGLVLTLTRRAHLESSGGELARALATASEAAEVLERARGNVSNPDLQASYFGSRLQPYDELVRLHLAIGERSGERERAAAAALASAERARARALKDLLAHTRGARPEGSEAEHAELMAQLNGRLLRLRDLQSELDSARQDEGRSAQLAVDIDAAKSALRRLRFELDALDARASAASPLHAALAAPADLSELRARLPEDLGVLAYYVGEDEATGWLLRRGSIRAFRLPPTAEIEAAAMEAYELASTWQPDVAPLLAALQRLAAALLPELGDEPGLKRLVIVPDGALHRVPFAALPLPGDERRVLLDRFEITTAPAVSLVRPGSAVWPPRDTRMAVFAAPVFDAAKLASRLRSPEPGEAGLAAILSSLGPLPYSTEEARRIRELAMHWTVELFEGEAATKRALLRPATANYSIVHFATHAVISSEFPELSGLVLSQVDADGRPVDGLLHLQEIYDLPLNADLVVLSACRTARGRDLRGEGPVSLGRAFLFAGARRVVTTHWNIPDDVTAELMAEFYAGMFESGLSPPAALREAQLSIAGEPASEQPFYWAGFTLTGTIVD